MARLPDASVLGGLGSAYSGRDIATMDDGGVYEMERAANNRRAQGVAEFVDATQDVVAELGRRRNEGRELELAKAESEWLTQNQKITAELDQDNFADKLVERYEPRYRMAAEASAQLISDTKLRERFLLKLRPDVEGGRVRASDRHRGLVQGQAVGDAITRLESLREMALEAKDPKAKTRYIDAANGLISGLQAAGHISPAEAAKQRQSWTRDYAQAQISVLGDDDRISALERQDGLAGMIAEEDRVKLLREAVANREIGRLSDPAYSSAIAAGVTPGFVDKVVGVESGGDPNAKNPNSTATGLGQFIESTWRQFMAERHPDQVGDILALRTDPTLSREAVVWYAEKNARALARNGLPVNDATLYLGHFLGPDGARRVLNAAPDAALADVLPAEVIAANSFLEGKTAAQLYRWAEGKMGERIGLDDASAGKVRAAAIADFNARKVATKEAMELAILQGQVSSEAQILADPVLDNGDKATLLRTFRSELKTKQDAIRAQSILASGGMLNIYDADERKALDRLYTDAVNAAVPEQRSAVAMEIVKAARYVPDSLVRDVRSGLISQDPEVVRRSLETASAAMAVNPSAFAGRDGAESIERDASMFDANRRLGLTEVEAASRVVMLRSPERRAERDALLKSDNVKKKIQKIDSGDVASIYDKGFFYSAPGVGANPMAEAAIVADYKEIFQESLVDTAGDEDLAAEMAKQRFKRLYAPSMFSMAGPKVITKLPPEAVYPAGPDGTHNYIREQVIQALAGEGVVTDEVYLQTYPETENDLKAGLPPRYQVYYRNGAMLEQFQLPFYAVPGAAVTQEPVAAPMVAPVVPVAPEAPVADPAASVEAGPAAAVAPEIERSRARRAENMRREQERRDNLDRMVGGSLEGPRSRAARIPGGGE